MKDVNLKFHIPEEYIIEHDLFKEVHLVPLHEVKRSTFLFVDENGNGILDISFKTADKRIFTQISDADDVEEGSYLYEYFIYSRDNKIRVELNVSQKYNGEYIDEGSSAETFVVVKTMSLNFVTFEDLTK